MVEEKQLKIHADTLRAQSYKLIRFTTLKSVGQLKSNHFKSAIVLIK